VIEVLSRMVTLVKRSRISASALSEPTVTLTARRKSCSKNATNFGVCRCSIAWGVTSTPQVIATCAKSSSDASGFCRNPKTNVRANDKAENLR
jgi:hypothetical protein